MGLLCQLFVVECGGLPQRARVPVWVWIVRAMARAANTTVRFGLDRVLRVVEDRPRWWRRAVQVRARDQERDLRRVRPHQGPEGRHGHHTHGGAGQDALTGTADAGPIAVAVLKAANLRR